MTIAEWQKAVHENAKAILRLEKGKGVKIMDGKELEKLLSALSEFTCPDIDISIHSLAEDVLRYIRDLKAEKEELQAKYNTAWKFFNRLEEEASKKTAKGIVQLLVINKMLIKDDYTQGYTDSIVNSIKLISDKFGKEVLGDTDE